MLEKMKNRITLLLADKTFSSDDELYRYLNLIVATAFAATMHLLLLAITLWLGATLLVILNILSVGIYIFAGRLLVKKRTYLASGLLIAVEVIAYTLTASVLIGVEGYILLYYFVLLLMQLTIPYAGVRVRVGVTVATWLAMVATILLGLYTTPVLDIGDGVAAMSFFNVNLAFFGIIIELSVGNYIKNIIVRYNASRLAEYKNQANTDPLTGLYNRWYAEKFFRSLREQEPDVSWCVAMMDIDDFKQVNDSLGHAVGDEVLKALADILRRRLRKSDVLFRWGGEEFLLFLCDVDEATAYEILDKLRQAISQTPVTVGNTEIRYTVTVGVAVLDKTDVEGSISRCDDCMYAGKTSGKNRVVA